MLNKPVLVIAAISSRPYVSAAVSAGYDVIAFDAFADEDTKQLGQQVYQVPCKNNQFDSKCLLALLRSVDIAGAVGFCYGAGFETQPALLADIRAHLPLIGNTPETISQCKNPLLFFGFCKKHAIRYPEISMTKPNDMQVWLKKQVGGSGGMHIQFVENSHSNTDLPIYYQKQQPGIPISCLFLASDNQVEIIGFNEQWVQACPSMPYRYGGAVSHVDISRHVKNKLANFVKLATQHFHLRGLNSCDAILCENEVYLLEINPRLSASIGLYDCTEANLMAAHISACTHQPIPSLKIIKNAKAHQVVYAESGVLVRKNKDDWPDWVCDIPSPNLYFDKDMPICTVTAEAPTHLLAIDLVKNRVAEIQF